MHIQIWTDNRLRAFTTRIGQCIVRLAGNLSKPIRKPANEAVVAQSSAVIDGAWTDGEIGWSHGRAGGRRLTDLDGDYKI